MEWLRALVRGARLEQRRPAVRRRSPRRRAPQAQEWDTVDHAPNWRERNVAWTRAGFTNLDHNRDNRITSNEWHFDNETFRRVDVNNDNAIDLNEFLGEDVDDMRDDRFDDHGLQQQRPR